jgi:hypothetical protein
MPENLSSLRKMR